MQFSLRLRAAPPEAELRLAADAQQPCAALHSVRVWAAEGGADVGIEFTLDTRPGRWADERCFGLDSLLHAAPPAVRSLISPCPYPGREATPARHRYWLAQGELHQQVEAAEAESSPARGPASRTKAAPARPPSPGKQHTPLPTLPAQQPRPRSAAARLAAAEAPAESPLHSLASEALPSFSPAKPAAAALATGPSAATAPAHAAAATPSTAALGWAESEPPAGSLGAAGMPSSSPVNARRPDTAGWAVSLRPPGEQLLPGLPDWDRSCPDLPLSGAVGLSGGTSRAGSRAGSRTSSHPGSPSRRQQRQGAAGGDSSGAATPARPQQAQQGSAAGSPAGAQAAPAQGPLTSMVVRAVSKLQALKELEEELQLPAAAGARGGSASPGQLQRGRQPQPAQQRPVPDLRRSLEPVLSAIRESMESRGEAGSHAAPSSSSRADGASRASASGGWVAGCGGGPDSAVSSRLRREDSRQTHERELGRLQREDSRQTHERELGRLRRLQEQLALNLAEVGAGQRWGGSCGCMQVESCALPCRRASPTTAGAAPQIQRREAEQAAHSPRSASPAPPPAAAAADAFDRLSSGESMPAAWDWQDPLPPPGRGRYHQHAAQPRAGSPARSVHWEPGAAGEEEGQEQAQPRGSGGGVVLAVANPLFGRGGSRPSTAQGMQSLGVALPPKRSLRRERSSEGETGSPASRVAGLRASSASLAEGQRRGSGGSSTAPPATRCWSPWAAWGAGLEVCAACPAAVGGHTPCPAAVGGHVRRRCTPAAAAAHPSCPASPPRCRRRSAAPRERG